MNSSLFGDFENFWPVSECNICPSPEIKTQGHSLGPIIETTCYKDEGFRALRPTSSQFIDYRTNRVEDYFLYPLISSHCQPCGHGFNILNLITWENNGPCDKKGMVFPIWFFRKAPCPEDCYAGFFPMGGNVKCFFGTDEINWFLFPFYLGIRRGCTTKHALPWPFIRWQTGPDSCGFAFWPFFGHFAKKGCYDKHYLLWPLIYKQCERLGPNDIRIRKGVLPFYAYESSNNRERHDFMWPFFSRVCQKKPWLYQINYFWPFFTQARGENTYINQWAPFYSYSCINDIEKEWLLWPLFKSQKSIEKGVKIHQFQFLYFLFWRQKQCWQNEGCECVAEKTHFWPFFSYWDNGQGRRQFQMLSPFEVFFPTNKVVRKTYSPLFALFQYEKICPDHVRHRLFFGLITAEKCKNYCHFALGPLLDIQCCDGKRRFEILKGLLGYRTVNNKTRFRLFWFTI